MTTVTILFSINLIEVHNISSEKSAVLKVQLRPVVDGKANLATTYI